MKSSIGIHCPTHFIVSCLRQAGSYDNPRGGAPTLFVVQDVLRSVDQHRDALGFHTGFTYGQPTLYAGIERDGVIIHLQAADRAKSQPEHGAVNVFVTDVDAPYQELTPRGAKVLNEPKDSP